MYLLVTKAYSYEETIIHCDTVVSIVPNGQLISLMTTNQTIDAIYVRGIDDKAMLSKCAEWVTEYFGEGKSGISSSH